MKSTKILFYIDDGFIEYGIAKFLQERNQDFELYSIFDTNHITKNFFKNQKFVNFKKSWFLRDFLPEKSKTPDVDYLQKIEKKYNLNLWKIAYSERQFYGYQFYGYNEFHKFTNDEILSIFEAECRLYGKRDISYK